MDRCVECWVCYKLTTAVLTCDDKDWFYVCLNHIQDGAFCKRLNPPPPVEKPTVQKPAAKTKEKTKETKAEDKTKESKKETDETEKDSAKDTDSVKETGDNGRLEKPFEELTIPDQKNRSAGSAAVPATASPAPAAVNQPAYYALDSKLFYMRQAEYRQKQQARIAKAVNSKLPSVPFG